MYIHDMVKTKGHIAAAFTARWDPKDKERCMTCSVDGTVRLWDVNTADKQQVTVIKCKNAKGQRATPTAASYAPNGDILAACDDGTIKCKNAKGQRATPTAACYAPNGDILAACDDGTIKLYDGRAVAKGSTQRAHQEQKTAHQVGTETTCVTVSTDGNTVLSRGGDDTLKVWDLRKFSGPPLKAYDNLMNAFDTTEAIFSPGGHLFCTGTSVRKNKDGTPAGVAHLHVYDKTTLQEVRNLDFKTSGSLITLIWHPKINQLFIGTSSGNVHCLYDPRQSEHGIMRAVGKQPVKSDFTNAGINLVGHIYAPHALPMFREEKYATKAKQKRKDRADPTLSAKPDLGPVLAAQRGLSYPGMATSRSFAQHLFKNAVGPSGQAYLDQDPREALLKFSSEVDANPTFTGAYKETQPEPIFDTSEHERKEKRAKPFFYKQYPSMGWGVSGLGNPLFCKQYEPAYKGY
ncbi:WD40-repeat-containing domain protein [Baffinella frigidus]|nr:WD40-repeat-containing domain protein [Cryptophyta sp. CCMP2293]